MTGEEHILLVLTVALGISILVVLFVNWLDMLRFLERIEKKLEERGREEER